MKIRYFKDTDTALLEFSAEEVSETREISEDVYLDTDASGGIVAMTIEHARERTNLPVMDFQEVG
jgi:uncharacterized protein YuzE